jgi:hypothetical protein
MQFSSPRVAADPKELARLVQTHRGRQHPPGKKKYIYKFQTLITLRSEKIISKTFLAYFSFFLQKYKWRRSINVVRDVHHHHIITIIISVLIRQQLKREMDGRHSVSHPLIFI